MKSSKYVLFLIATFILILTACGGGNSEQSTGSVEGVEENSDDSSEANKGETAGKTIRVAMVNNGSHPSYDGLTKFKEIVEEKTDGALNVEIFHSGQLGDDRSVLEGLQFNTLEAAITGAPITIFVPQVGIFDLPFLFPNEEVAYSVLDGEVGQKVLDLFPEQNLIGLGFWELGFRNITNDKHPIESAKDLKGLKLRTTENEVHLDTISALGGTPTPMAFTELYTSLQQGVIDGQENPYAITYLEKFYEIQKYISNTQHIYSTAVFSMSKEFFESLSEEEQNIVKEAAVEARNYNREVSQKANAEHLASLEEAGMIFTEITPEARQEMVELVKPVIEKYKESLGGELVEELYEAIDSAQ